MMDISIDLHRYRNWFGKSTISRSVKKNLKSNISNIIVEFDSYYLLLIFIVNMHGSFLLWNYNSKPSTKNFG